MTPERADELKIDDVVRKFAYKDPDNSHSHEIIEILGIVKEIYTEVSGYRILVIQYDDGKFCEESRYTLRYHDAAEDVGHFRVT